VFLGRGVAVPGEPGVVREGASGWDKTDDERIARRAGDARVALQIVHTAGTPPGRGMFREAGRIQSSQLMAELTGGSFTSDRMAADQLAAIDESTRFSYLLGYTPLNPELDGKFRRVRVEVNRPDLVVRYQHGYYADETPPEVMKELLVSSRLNTAAAIAQTASSIKVTATARMLPRMGITEMARVEIVIDASQIAFESADGVLTGTLDVQVYAGDEKERVVGEAADRLDLKATEVEHAEWLRTGIRHSVRLPLTATPRHIKVVVYDFGSDRVGSAMSTIGKLPSQLLQR
jgi:hypothetical protein